MSYQYLVTETTTGYREVMNIPDQTARLYYGCDAAQLTRAQALEIINRWNSTCACMHAKSWRYVLQ